MSDAQPEPSVAVKLLRWMATQPEIENIADRIRDAVEGCHTASSITALIRVIGDILSLASPDGQEELLAALLPAVRARIKIAATEKRIRGHG